MSQGRHDDVMITRKRRRRRPEMWITCLAGREIPEGAGRLHGPSPCPGAAASYRGGGDFHEPDGGNLGGCGGTTALDIVTYLDMTVRGRPASVLPAQAAGKLADRAGADLGSGEVAESRREGVGALLGYAVGLGVGGLYGLLAGDRSVPLPVAALGLSVAGMAAGDAPYTALRLTDRASGTRSRRPRTSSRTWSTA